MYEALSGPPAKQTHHGYDRGSSPRKKAAADSALASTSTVGSQGYARGWLGSIENRVYCGGGGVNLS